ncbi:MAG: XdhC family protein [Candidatus Asgardarchaeia archaeon]
MRNEELFSQISKFLKEGKTVAICTIVKKIGSGPRDVGTKLILTDAGDQIGTIGGGAFERLLLDKVKEALKSRKPRYLVFSLYGDKVYSKEAIKTGLICGGELHVFVDIVEPNPKMVIIGSGHIAKPVYDIANMLGFEITVADDNATTLTEERFPNAKRIYNENFEEALKQLDIRQDTFVVIVHGEPNHDRAALNRVIPTDAKYIGFLSSKAKAVTLFKELKEKGVPIEKIRSIYTPIGLDIGATTPEEIAVSIMSEIVKIMRGGTGNHSRDVYKLAEKLKS